MMIDDVLNETVTILDFLKALPNEVERKYEIDFTKLVENVENRKLRSELKNILTNENTLEEKVIYAAFYCLAILYRRTKDISLLEELIVKYEYRFKNTHPTFMHVYVLYLKEKGVGRDFVQIIQKSFEAYNNLKNNAGVVHNFAETIASAYEESDLSTQQLVQKEWITKAEEAINLAINLDSSYAKYYCTKGRLLAIVEKYTEAKESIKRAIDIEDSEKIDYVIRLGNYQYYLLLVQNSQYNKVLDNQLAEHKASLNTIAGEIDKKLKETNIKNLEFLGFFAAIVSFTIGSIQIINNQSFRNASNLIIVLFVALLCVFSAFGFMLNGLNKKSIPNTIVFFIGIILLCVFRYFS